MSSPVGPRNGISVSAGPRRPLGKAGIPVGLSGKGAIVCPGASSGGPTLDPGFSTHWASAGVGLCLGEAGCDFVLGPALFLDGDGGDAG